VSAGALGAPTPSAAPPTASQPGASLAAAVPAAMTPSSGEDDIPFPTDDDFDPDDDDMSAPMSMELTGMALVQRELGAEIIAEYED
jgi:hypothetical protein